MIKVVLLGSGNVAYHLALALKLAEGVELVQRYSRQGNNDQYFDPSLPVVNTFENLEKADVYIIAVKDDAIPDVSKQMEHLQGLVVHTSGGVDMKALNATMRRGVLYPVQTFTLNQPVDFEKVPLAIEAATEDDLQLLEKLAKSLSTHVLELNSAGREKLHVTAVFANNFSNYMFSCAHALCDEFELPFDVLKPIILETGKKVQHMDPMMAQTGPARRNDQSSIEKHVNMLHGDKKEIYKRLSEAIIDQYQTKEEDHGKKL